MVHSHTVQTMILATGARTQRAIDGWQTGQTTSVRLDAHALDRGYGSRAGTAIAITSVGHRAYGISKAQTSHCRERSPTWFGYDHAARKLQ